MSNIHQEFQCHTLAIYILINLSIRQQYFELAAHGIRFDSWLRQSLYLDLIYEIDILVRVYVITRFNSL